jgi:putative N6-adenine-specific DNA methylase
LKLRNLVKMNQEFELIAKTFQGLEEVLAQELTELGAGNIEIGRRMVSFTGDKAMMYRANFCLRTAIRILKPIKHFTAKTADEVYEAVKSIAWEDYLDNMSSFAVDAVVFSNEFRHSKFVAYKVKDAIVDYFREKTGNRPSVRISNPDLAINIHVAEDRCTLSLDSSGESLHRRGYRQEQVEAPLNEVLAAGMILMTGWRGECDLIDPMCGSGTIPIEAALIARNIAPGVFRKEFGFEKWRDFDQDLFDSIYNDDSNEREFNHKIYGYDNNPKANEIAVHNVKAAGVSKDVILKIQPFQQFEQPKEKSIIVTNPPYGERISSDDLLGLYQMIGERLKHAYGYRGAMFPWESDDSGEEATPTHALTGPFEHHITADIGIACWNYYCVTRDMRWLQREGYPLLKEIADFWASRVTRNQDGSYSIHNVTGADEYANGVTDNAFTNGAASLALKYACQAAEICGEKVPEIWREIGENIRILQFENGVTREHSTYKGEMIKQADANLLAYPLGVITDEYRQRQDLEYYAERIDQKDGPAMSYSVYCVQYARMGEADKAYEMFRRCYEPNLKKPFGVISETPTSNNPYFMTGAGGLLQAVLNGFCGLQITDEGIVQLPSALPSHWKRVTVTGVGSDKKTYVRER